MIVSFIIENVGLWCVAGFYWQDQSYKQALELRKGVNVACDKVELSEDLTTVLQKMEDYYPTIDIFSDGLVLTYGTEVPEGISTSMVFDKKYYKLTNKACGTAWKPEPPRFLEQDFR